MWSNPVSLWEDTVRKSPNKPRAHLQLAQSYYDAGQYAKAIAEFEQASRIEKPEYNTAGELGRWRCSGWAARLSAGQAAAGGRAGADGARVVADRHDLRAARAAAPRRWRRWRTAEKLDPNWAPTYNYRAKVHFQANELTAAVADYRRALALDPSLADARDELMRAEAMLRAAGGK